MFKRVAQVFLCSCLVAGSSHAADDPFVGQWKLVKLTDEMKVTSVGANTYAFDFGGGAETIVLDGTDQRGGAGTTLSVAAVGPNWKVVRKQDGRTLLTATWTLSEDGKALRDHFTQFAPDGSSSTADYLYARKTAGSSFTGTWVGTITPLGAAIVLQVRPHESDGLSVIIPGQPDTTSVVFDGKEISTYDEAARVYAQTPQLGGVDESLVYFVHDLGMRLPLAALFLSRAATELDRRVRSVAYVEKTGILGAPAHHLVGRTDTVDFQVWIADGDQPLPQRIVLTYPGSPGQPQFRAQFSAWNLTPEATESLFTFTAPAGTSKIPFAAALPHYGPAPPRAPVQKGAKP